MRPASPARLCSAPHRRRWSVLSASALVFVLGLVAGCDHPGQDLGAPDAYRLLVPQAAEQVQGLPLVVRSAIREDRFQPLTRVLDDGFASELLRTLYLCKHYLREAAPVAGRPVGAAARIYASHATLFLLEPEGGTPAGRGLAFARTIGSAVVRPELVWIGLPSGVEADPAAVQTLAGRIAGHIGVLASTAGTFDDNGEPEGPGSPLVAGYRMAMEVIAREWKTTRQGGGSGGMKASIGTPEQRKLVPDVRENRFVVRAAGAPLPSPAELMSNPGVAATIIYRMAQAKEIGLRVAPAAFYEPFVKGRVPPGMPPVSILGPFRNFQVKLLGVWIEAVRAGRDPKDIIDLIERYISTFPDERRPVVWTFLATTLGATVTPGGLSSDPAAAAKTIEALKAMTEEIVAGKQELRSAFPKPPEAEPAPR